MADDFHTIALDCFKLASEASQHQREREKADLEFQDPSKQWPKEVRDQREAQVINGVSLPSRPMLSIPTLDQPIQLELNKERAANLGVQVHALSEDADDDTAEVIEGLYRSIEMDSRANLARSWGFQRAVLAGRGAYRVNTVYDRTSPVRGDQKIVIERILYQESVLFDPLALEPDYRDGEWAFEVSWMRWREYQRKYPHSKLSGYSESEILAELQTAPAWIQGETKESRAVLVARYWRVEKGDDDADISARTVYHSLINAVEVLEPEQPWNGHYIPLIPAIGRELIPFDGERRWLGMIGPNKDAARLFNYAASNAVEIAALETKAQFDVDPEEIQGFEGTWAQANVRNFVYLPRHKFAANGQPYPPVQRIQADTSRLGPSMLLLQHAKDFVHTGTGAYEPSLGQESKAKSGRQVLALQQQHEQGNSHWLDNLAEISLNYEATVVLDLIPAVYDRPGRVERVLDIEGNKKAVCLNAPFMPPQNGKGRPQPLPMGPDGRPTVPPGCAPDQVKHYDLSKGRYGVSVSVGKAYKSRLEEGSDLLGNLFSAQPELFRFLGDIWLGFQSWPGHKAAESRMKKMLPPELQDEEQRPDSAQQLAQAQAAIQQLQQQLAQAAEIIITEQVKQLAQVLMKQAEVTAKLESERMRNATQIAIAHINAAAKGAQIDAHAIEEAIALGHDANQADVDRQHEAQQNAFDRAHEAALTAMQPSPVSGNGQTPESE